MRAPKKNNRQDKGRDRSGSSRDRKAPEKGGPSGGPSRFQITRKGADDKKPAPRNDDKPTSKPGSKSDSKSPSDDKARPIIKARHSNGVARQFKKPKAGKAPVYNDSGLIRLNKYIANAGICSRREADVLIQSGIITVNGKPVTELGTKVKPTDHIKYGDQSLSTEKMRYILLNKPKDFLTTTDDPRNRRTVMELVKNACKENIFPVGQLDRDTTGLLLFTNDGDLAKVLMHPSHKAKKIYHVFLDRDVLKGHLNELVSGVTLDDGPAKAEVASYVGDDHKQVGVEMQNGKNRVVNRMFEHFGYKIKKLDRVTYVGLTKKDLPRGKFRELTETEIVLLKRAANQG